MRKFVFSMIAVFGVIAVGLILLMVSVISSGGRSFSIHTFSDADLVKTTNLSIEGISSLSLEYSSDDIFFYESDTDELILKEYMNIEPEEEVLTKIRQTSSEIRLVGGERNKFRWGIQNYKGYVELYLPADYHGSISASTSSGNIESELVLRLSELNASCTSGDICLNEVYAEDIRSSSSSGNIQFNIAEGNRTFVSTSGDIEVKGGNGDSEASSTSGNITIENGSGALRASASSGDITIEAIDGEKVIETTSGVIRMYDCSGYTSATASSGDIEIQELTSAGDFESTSGNIDVSFTKDMSANGENIEANASSGNISLELPSGLSFEFNARTSSGDIDTFFDDSLSFQKDGDHADGTIGSVPDFDMELSTTSGNITVDER